jgi:hypothetical protein
MNHQGYRAVKLAARQTPEGVCEFTFRSLLAASHEAIAGRPCDPTRIEKAAAAG